MKGGVFESVRGDERRKLQCFIQKFLQVVWACEVQIPRGGTLDSRGGKCPPPTPPETKYLPVILLPTC